MFVRQETNASYGFKAPNSVVDTDKKVEVLFPSVDTQSPDYAATINLTVDQLNTIVEVGALTGNPTINVAVDDEVTKNAEMLLKLTASGGARTVTLGTGFSGSAIVVPSGATVYALLKYDGTNFVVVTSTNDDVQDGAITAAKLATDAVETAKIKNDAVTSDKIADDAITADHLASNAVETAAIKDKNVTLAKLEDGTAGDMLYFNGTAWTKLPKGTSGQTLKMNTGATAPEWVTV
ncbi:MAG: hypothetical protein KAZ36_00325 [Bacteroidales bacterium]|jgi:hypothetical protein|nr:hypothetical protein [Bacteroidales bacterium]